MAGACKAPARSARLTALLRARSEQLLRLKEDSFALLFEEMRKLRSPDELHEAKAGSGPAVNMPAQTALRLDAIATQLENLAERLEG